MLRFTLFPSIGVQPTVPHAVSLEEAEAMDNTQFIAKVNTQIYCLLSSVIFIDTLEA